jgi:hypothetical protein
MGKTQNALKSSGEFGAIQRLAQQFELDLQPAPYPFAPRRKT